MPIDAMPIFTPDDVMAGARPEGSRVAVYDDDHYCMGGALAELLRAAGYEVAFITPEAVVSAWTVNTMEQHRIQARLIETGIGLRTSTAVSAVLDTELHTQCTFTRTGKPHRREYRAASHRPPTRGQPVPGPARPWPDQGLRTVRAIGDALAPSTIAAVWEGRCYAEELEAPTDNSDTTPYQRELTALPQ